jgi:hypothetical protein
MAHIAIHEADETGSAATWGEKVTVPGRRPTR